MRCNSGNRSSIIFLFKCFIRLVTDNRLLWFNFTFINLKIKPINPCNSDNRFSFACYLLITPFSYHQNKRIVYKLQVSSPTIASTHLRGKMQNHFLNKRLQPTKDFMFLFLTVREKPTINLDFYFLKFWCHFGAKFKILSWRTAYNQTRCHISSL